MVRHARYLAALAFGLVLAGCGAPGAGRIDGAMYDGEGYSILVPASPVLQYRQVSGMDSWADVDATVAFSVEYVPLVTSADGMLETATSRAESQLGDATVTELTLPAGATHRIEASNGTLTMLRYLVFSESQAAVVTFFGTAPDVATEIMETLTFD